MPRLPIAQLKTLQVRRIDRLALLAALAVVAAAGVANVASATAERAVRSDRSLYQLAKDGPSSAEVSTLTNSVGQPRRNAEPQLALGVGLLVVGLLGLVYSLLALLFSHRRPIARGVGELLVRG